MKVGVLQFFSWPGRRVPLETVYARTLQRIEVMDRTGYDAVWLAEHHFSTYSVCPSVHLMGMHVASRTRNLRIGTAVSLAPFYHPLRLAEEVALLDVLSGGRVNWGAGRGFDPREFAAFGVPVEESRARFQEAVEIVLAAWRSERLRFEGRYWRFEEVEVLPKPLQRPHPPVWMAATSPDAIRWAAERGYSILMDPHSTGAEMGRKRALYAQSLREHGHTLLGREIPVARLLAVGETEREAEEVARQGAEWTVGSYVNPKKAPGIAPSGGGFIPADAPDPIERYLRGVILYGTPASLPDRIDRLREETGLEYLLCAPLSHRSFELFTDKVLPRLA
jgi:alkanesulfonate monooxygenase SsuD/methylene tetrahydromethanopterin reductase-like flavin-dependent oxidoreductase (luciferase family)